MPETPAELKFAGKTVSETVADVLKLWYFIMIGIVDSQDVCRKEGLL